MPGGASLPLDLPMVIVVNISCAVKPLVTEKGKQEILALMIPTRLLTMCHLQ